MSEIILAEEQDDALQAAEAPGRSASRFWRSFRRNPLAVAGAIILLLLVVISVLAPVLAPHDPLDQDLRNTFASPGREHWLGTDNLGRDVLSRLLYGARISIPAAGLAVATAVGLGVPVGMLMGYFGGWWDRIGLVVTDVILTFPGVILAISLVAVFGNNLVTAMLALGLVFAPAFVRLTRGEVLAARAENYVTAASLLGFPTWRILFRHMLPNVVSPAIIQLFISFSFALLAQSGLAFLGIGVQPPTPAWGSMLAESTTFMATYPRLIIPPGVAIAITALSASLVGDGIRDSLGAGVRTATVRSVSRATPRAGSATPRPSDEHVLQIHDLTVGFEAGKEGWTDVVHGVSLAVPRGATLGLVGESGSGKSVTALAVLGLLPTPLVAREGTIDLNGVDLMSLSERELRSVRGSVVSMIFQDPLAALNPTLTVGHQLVEAIRLYSDLSRDDARARAIQLLERVEITRPADRLHAYPHEFSGGMAQRVMIAMAIAGEPRLIVADEPTTALDVTVQVEILDLLRQLQSDTGVGVLFITHDMGVVADICDHAAVMYRGQIVETATVDDLFAAPKHSYTRELMNRIPDDSRRDHRVE